MIRLFIVFIFLIGSIEGNAQVLKGKVTDKQNGDPLPFATVYLPGSDKTIMSGRTGEFETASLSSADSILILSYTGYTSVRYLIADGNAGGVINIQMSRASANTGEPVSVVALRRPEEEKYVPAAVNILTADDFDRYGSRTLPEFLATTNGIFVQKTNHGGGSAFLRGLTGNQVLTLVDGIRLNNSTFRYGPNQYVNTIDAFSIGRIEVVRGTGSVQYGSDAMGGVMDVMTKQPDYYDGVNHFKNSMLKARYMNGDMEKTLRGEVHYGGKNVAAYVGGTVREFGDLIGGKNTGKQVPSGYDEWAVDGKLRFRLSKQAEVILGSQFLRQTDVPVYHKVVLENFLINQFSVQQRSLQYARLKVNGNSSIVNSIEITASVQNSLEERESQKNNNPVRVFEQDKINTLGLTASIESVFSRNWRAVSGIEVYSDRVNSSRDDVNTSTSAKASKRGLYPDDASFGNYSIYSLHYLTAGKFRLSAGARYNTFNIKIQDTTLGTVKTTPSALVFNGGVTYSVNGKANIYASVSSGYRAPNIDDMGTLGIVDFRYEVPSYDLSPEKSLNMELGFKYSSTNFDYTVSAYYLKLNDIITRERSGTDSINSYQVYLKRNTQSAYITGIESRAAYSFLRYFTATASVTYAYGKSISNNEPLRRVPPLFGSAEFIFARRAFSLSADLQYAAKQSRLAKGDMDDNRIPKGGTPGWTTVNFNARYFYKRFELGAGLLNLFDVDYRTHGSGINGYGRSVYLQLSFRL